MKIKNMSGLRHLLSIASFTAFIAAFTIAFADAPSQRKSVTLAKTQPAASQSLEPRTELAKAAPQRAPASKSSDAQPKPKPTPTPTGTININLASVNELVKLPGVGPKKAELIVAWRSKHGKFERVLDLRRVKGFGAKSVKKLLPYLAVTGKNTLQ